MKSKFKSALSLCLAVVLMVTMFSGMAYADNTTSTVVDDTTPIEMLEPKSIESFDITIGSADVASEARLEQPPGQEQRMETTSEAIPVQSPTLEQRVQAERSLQTDRVERALQNDVVKSAPNNASDNDQTMQADRPLQTDRAKRALQSDVVKSAPNNASDADQTMQADRPLQTDRAERALQNDVIKSVPNTVAVLGTLNELGEVEKNNVTPFASGTLSVSPLTDWSVAASGGTRALSVSGTGWTTYSVSCPSWITVTHTAAGKTTLTAKANTSSARSGYVDIDTNNGLNKYFYVTQAAGASSLTVSPLTDWSVAASGGTRALSVSGTGWTTYSVSCPSWITVTHTAAGKTTLTAKANTSSARSGYVDIDTNNGLNKYFYVTQAAGASSLTVSPLTEWSVAASGGTRALSVSGTGWTTYSVSCPSWITVTHTAAGKTTLTAKANTSSARSGYVDIDTNNGLNKYFYVTQAAGAASLTISPSTDWTNLSAAGGTVRSVTVSTSLSTYWLWKPSWINNEFTSSGAKLTTTANTGAARSGTIKFTQNQDGSGLSQSFTVTQLAGTITPYLTISPSTDWTNISAAGGAQRTVNVTTNLPTYSIAGRPAWLELAWLTGTTGFKLTAQANTGVARSATITVKGDGVPDRSFNVSQVAGTSATGTITITYNGNGHTGGTVPATQTLITPCTFQFRDPTMTKTNYTFAGWKSSGGTIYEVGKTYSYSTATTGSLAVTAEWKAEQSIPTRPTSPANAGWAMPNSILTRITFNWGEPHPVVPHHYGVDLCPPVGTSASGTSLYPVLDGVVYSRGYNTTAAGYHIIYELDQYHWSTNKQPKIIYMHMRDYPLVAPNTRVYRGQTLLGYVGGTNGTSEGLGAHLHFEIRTDGTDNVWANNLSATENPLLYYPSIFSSRTSRAAVDQANNVRLQKAEGLVPAMTVIDSPLIDFVGVGAFEQWLNATVCADETELFTVLDFLDYFGISLQQYQELMTKSNAISSIDIQEVVEYAHSAAASQAVQEESDKQTQESGSYEELSQEEEQTTLDKELSQEEEQTTIDEK